MRVRWTRAARKHRFSRDQSRHVIEQCGLVFREQPPSGVGTAPDDRLLYLGDDPAGVELEVMAVELNEDSLLVIHAMPLREKYRLQYEEAKTWRK